MQEIEQNMFLAFIKLKKQRNFQIVFTSRHGVAAAHDRLLRRARSFAAQPLHHAELNYPDASWSDLRGIVLATAWWPEVDKTPDVEKPVLPPKPKSPAKAKTPAKPASPATPKIPTTKKRSRVEPRPPPPLPASASAPAANPNVTGSNPVHAASSQPQTDESQVDAIEKWHSMW